VAHVVFREGKFIWTCLVDCVDRNRNLFHFFLKNPRRVCCDNHHSETFFDAVEQSGAIVTFN
jgi:hypothetical protein